MCARSKKTLITKVRGMALKSFYFQIHSLNRKFLCLTSYRFARKRDDVHIPPPGEPHQESIVHVARVKCGNYDVISKFTHTICCYVRNCFLSYRFKRINSQAIDDMICSDSCFWLILEYRRYPSSIRSFRPSGFRWFP